MDAFPAPDPRDAEVLVAKQVPRPQWRNDDTWVRFYLHVCQTVPPPSRRFREPAVVPRNTGVERPHGRTAGPGTQARLTRTPCACRRGDARGETTTRSHRPRRTTEQTARAARKPEHIIGPSPRMEAQAPVLAQANGANAQTNAAWREVEAKLTDETLRHDSPKTLHASAGWLRTCRGCMARPLLRR